MKKKQIHKYGMQEVLKKGLSHQVVFNTLKEKGVTDFEEAAEILSKVPSTGKMEATKLIRNIFLGLIILLIILRVLGVIGLAMADDFHPAMLIAGILFGLIVPAVGVYAAVTGNPESFRLVGILLIVGVVRSFRSIEADPFVFIGIGLVAAVAILAFVIPSKLKTPYQKVVKQGADKNYYEYHFEDTRASSDEILDANL